MQGAAIKDILKVLDRRFKEVHIMISSVRVQGEGAKDEIARAIEDFNVFNQDLPAGQRIEVMIVGRGGGSTEDLWAFNEEIVARAIYKSKIPVISAVGHERDWSISDLVADLRAPTPSVAAELVIPKKEDLEDKLTSLTRDLRRSFEELAWDFQERLDGLAHRLGLNMGHILKLNFNQFEGAIKKLKLLNPAALICSHQEKIAGMAKAMQVCISHFLELRESFFAKAVEKLANLSPLNILSRGYSIAFAMPQGKIIKDAALLKVGEMIKTKLHKGEILSQVREVNTNGGD